VEFEMRVKKIVELRTRFEKAIANYVDSRDRMFEEDETPGYVDPVADVYLDGDRQLIFIETPAMDEKSVVTEVQDDLIVVTAKKNVPRPAGRKYSQMERAIGTYQKKVSLAFRDREIENISHSYKFGVIKIEIIYGEKNEIQATNSF